VAPAMPAATTQNASLRCHGARERMCIMIPISRRRAPGATARAP
jgi:hypothetical protein